MRSTHLFAPLALAAGLAFMAAPADSQVTCSVPTAGGSCTANQDATATVLHAAQLGVASASVSLTPDFDPLAQPAPIPQADTYVQVVSNAPWSLSIQAASGTWTGGNDDKPAGDLEWLAAKDPTLPSGNGTPISTSPADIAASQPATTSGVVQYNIHYLSNWSVADPPGAYSLTLIYTLTAP